MARRKRKPFVRIADNQPVQAHKSPELEIVNTSIMLAFQIIKALSQK